MFVGWGQRPQGLALDLKHLRKQRGKIGEQSSGLFPARNPRMGFPVWLCICKANESYIALAGSGFQGMLFLFAKSIPSLRILRKFTPAKMRFSGGKVKR